MSDWTSFGRVDADGTVYVKTAEGERAVGSWQAGAPEEGLAHFARRFADLVTEVDLTEARLQSGAADASHSLTTIRRLRASLVDAHVVGDLDSLAERLDKLTTLAEEKATEAKAARETARAEALARKTTLVEEAEKLAAESTGWKTAGDRFKEILDEWKTIRGVDKKTDGELWKRFAAARDGFTRRRGAHFATLDAQRKQAQTAKNELVAEAERLAESTEWAATANRLKELMTEWKAAPRASKEAEQKLWERFRAAQDAFFTRRSEVFSARDAEQRGNLERKQALLAELEAVDVDADPRTAQAKLRDVQGQWHDIGRVPREAAAGLDRRLRSVEDRVREAMDSAWRRTEPSANPLLTQMREQVA
jgi:chromosome segregation ATPase